MGFLWLMVLVESARKGLLVTYPRRKRGPAKADRDEEDRPAAREPAP